MPIGAINCTCGFDKLVFSPFVIYVSLGLPFTNNGILITVYISAFAERVGSGVPIVMAVLAAISDASFPGIPTCDGTQSNCTSRLFIFCYI